MLISLHDTIAVFIDSKFDDSYDHLIWEEYCKMFYSLYLNGCHSMKCFFRQEGDKCQQQDTRVSEGNNCAVVSSVVVYYVIEGSAKQDWRKEQRFPGNSVLRLIFIYFIFNQRTWR